ASELGSITITGPGANSRLAGFITNSGFGNDTQTVSTTGRLTVTGGSAAAQGNNFGTGIFHNRQGVQTINAGDIVVQGGTGGSIAGVRIGGFGGATPSATNLTMNVGGDLVLAGGAANNGVGLGSSAVSSQPNNINIHTGGNVVLNQGSGAGARIGGEATD